MSPAKKAIVGAFTTAVANCLMDHLFQWCLFEALGLDCPRRSA